MSETPPHIDWVKNDKEKHQFFTDGSRFLVALQVGRQGGPYEWEFAIVVTNCDGEGMTLQWPEGEYYSDWNWEDFEWFKLLEGEMPTAEMM